MSDGRSAEPCMVRGCIKRAPAHRLLVGPDTVSVIEASYRMIRELAGEQDLGGLCPAHAYMLRQQIADRARDDLPWLVVQRLNRPDTVELVSA